jgi:hypothetical protein
MKHIKLFEGFLNEENELVNGPNGIEIINGQAKWRFKNITFEEGEEGRMAGYEALLEFIDYKGIISSLWVNKEQLKEIADHINKQIK